MRFLIKLIKPAMAHPMKLSSSDRRRAFLARCLCGQVELFTAENAEPPGEFAQKFKITPAARLRQAGNPCPCEDRVRKEIPHGAHADLDTAQSI